VNRRLLIVDDEPDILGAIKQSLAGFDLQIESTQSPLQAIELCRKQRFDIVITDFKMKPINGIKLIEKIKDEAPQTEFVVMTGFASYDSALKALKLGVFDYIEKPFTPEAIRLIIKNLYRTLELTDENKKLSAILQNRQNEKQLIGQSPAFNQTLEIIQKVSPTDSTILLLGESGTGKEILAGEIHRLSARADKPMIICNCAALPENLIESELFGHEPGAFTDAKKLHRGSFELADGGTIFLDEIGEMPRSIQKKLLRTLENKEVKRVGGERIQKVDIRVIVATNRDLKEMVAQEKFREDLYYRLNIIPIKVPPLRKRREDIPLLAEHFLQVIAHKTGKIKPKISNDALNVLMNYTWKGNIRELKNVMERAVILNDNSVLDLTFISFILDEHTENVDSLLQHLPVMELKTLQEKYIRFVLKRYDHNQTKAAKALGIGTSTLWRHLKEEK